MIDQYITPNYYPALVLAAVALLCAIVVLPLYVGRIFAVARKAKAQAAEELPDKGYPSASVVVYCDGNTEGLVELLEQLVNQDYPAPFEIIVVNSGRELAAEAATCNMAAYMEGKIRVHHTFIPHHTCSLSRKKLGLTLGIKAARHDAIVHVTSDCCINSPMWLRHMALPLADSDIDIVLGHTVWPTTPRVMRHDRLIDSIHYLASALAGQTYRGEGDNLAYRRSVFFDLKGFSNSLNLHYGDDDIFVADASTETNVAVALAPEAHVIVRPRGAAQIHRYSKLRHTFTATFTRPGQHVRYSLAETLMWVWLAVTVGAIALAPTNVVVAGACLLAALMLWIPMLTAMACASRRLTGSRLLLLAPSALMRHPFTDFHYRLRCKRAHDQQYAWQSSTRY